MSLPLVLPLVLIVLVPQRELPWGIPKPQIRVVLNNVPGSIRDGLEQCRDSVDHLLGEGPIILVDQQRLSLQQLAQSIDERKQS